MKIYFTSFFLLIYLSLSLFAQQRSLRGIVYDSIDKKPLSYAHVVLSPIPFIDFPLYTTTNEKGYFEFRRISAGKYLLEITFIGYEKYVDTIFVNWSGKNLDTIFLKQTFLNIGDVYVIDKTPPVEQKGDTLEFNAMAFRTAPNSSLEELVLKLPGVEKEENVIKVQGEEVKRILVDGRRFFGNDPEIALKNLPADIVEKIQLFDKKSEQAELTGFEDDQTEKTFNVITRVDKRKGLFGKFYSGYGLSDRFNSGINFNSFNAEERLSFLGIANNVNQVSFSADGLTGSEQFITSPGGRWQRGRGNRNQNPLLNIQIPADEGNNNVYAFGLNYSNIFKQKLELNGSYFFNRLDNQNNTKTNRKYLSELSGLDSYNETINSNGKSFNHLLNLFIDYKPDTINIIRIKPDLQFSTSNNSIHSFSENFLLDQNPLNSNYFHRVNEIENFELNTDAVYSHRFSKPGRSFTIGLNTSFSKRSSDYELFSQNSAIEDSIFIRDTLNQISNYINKRLNSTLNLSFTEKLGDNSLIRLRFNPQLINEERMRDTYKSDSFFTNQIIFDSLFSNSYKTQNLAIRGSASYRYNSEIYNFEFDLMYQNQSRLGIQRFPEMNETTKRFKALLPSFEFTYRPTEFERLRIDFNTRIQIPTISQLQNTIDFSNPNFLRTGNPELNMILTNNLNLKYFKTNLSAGTFNAYSFNMTYSLNNISNNVIVFTQDTVLERNIIISRGTQLSYPVNVGNALFLGLNSTNSFRLPFLKSNLSFSTSVRYSRVPNLISGKSNITTQYGVSENVALNSSDPKLDYRVNYSPDFTYSINSLNKKISRILIHRANFSVKANIFENLYLSSRVNYYKNTAASNNDKSNIIWNMALSYYFLNNQSGELKLEIIDLLNQRKKLMRIIREDYYEDRITQQLERFFILSFTYNLKMFN